MFTVQDCRKLLQKRGYHDLDHLSDDVRQRLLEFLYQLAELQIENDEWLLQNHLKKVNGEK